MLVRIATIGTLLIFGSLSYIATPAKATQLLPRDHRIRDLPLKNQANWYRKNIHHAKATLRWWKNQGSELLESSVSYRRTRKADIRYHQNLLRNAQRKYNSVLASIEFAARPYYLRIYPRHLSAWNCIHRYEGSWTDPNAPYYGGLQMDWNFMSTYGSDLLAKKGTADNWTPLEQMQVAENALAHGRGFYPWPNSARMCGLI